MMRRILCLLVSVLPALALGCGDYSRLNRAVETYQPPLDTVSRGADVREESKPPVETDYALEKKRIHTARARWEAALKKVPTSKDAFFCPPSELVDKLMPAASDPEVAGAALIPRFSLDTLMTLTLLRNPEIQAGEDRARAAMDTYSQILALDDILRRYTAFTQGLMTGIGPMKGKAKVDKEFPFPGVLSLKGDIVNQGIKAAMDGLAIARRDAVTEARKAYWHLLFVRKAERITMETLHLYKRLEQVATTRYETGDTSYQDVIKVRIQRELLEEEADTFREKAQNWKSKILELLNLPPETEVGRPENRDPLRTVPALDPLYALARDHRQELSQLRARVGKMERLIELGETMILPPYALDLSLYENDAIRTVGSFATREPFPVSVSASKGFGLPKKPWYGIEDAYLRETQQRLNALKKELEREEARTAMGVRDAWFRLDLAKREESLYRASLLTLTRTVLDVSTQGYEAGNVAFADVIASYNAWLETHLAAEQELSALGIAWARLENAVGVPLRLKEREACK